MNTNEAVVESWAKALSEYEKKKAAERAADLAKPFPERLGWRKDHMYKGWVLEPVVETYGPHIATTRSNYGYLCLNTPLLGMIDVDLNPDYDLSIQTLEALANLQDHVADHPDQSYRICRTAGGLRIHRTDAPQPLDDSFIELTAKIFHSDKLYAKLCVGEQAAFRMRVSPRLERIGLEYPRWNAYDVGGDGWNCSDPGHTKVPLAIQAYEILAPQYKVCEFIGVIGSGVVHDDLRRVLEVHDDLSGLNTSREMESVGDTGALDIQFIAFNEIYRPHGMCPDLIWETLPWRTRSALQSRKKESVMAEHDRQFALWKKWKEPLDKYSAIVEMVSAIRFAQPNPAYLEDMCSAEEKLVRLKRAAKFAQNVRLCRFNPACPCAECIVDRKMSVPVLKQLWKNLRVPLPSLRARV